MFGLISSFLFHPLWLSMYNVVSISSTTLPQSITPKVCTQHIYDKSADCHSLGLKLIPDNLARDLRTLDLHDNVLPILLNNSFMRYPFLTRLDLSENRINSIQELAFFSLRHLRKLDLKYNNFVSLDNGVVFKWLSELSYLDLSHCHLTVVPNKILSYLPKLQYLSLNANNITSVNLSSCGRKVLDLSLSHNHIQNLTSKSFVLKCKCSNLILDSNYIRNFDSRTVTLLPTKNLHLSYQSHPGFTRETWNKLFTGFSCSVMTGLLIAGNALGNVPAGFFAPLHNRYHYMWSLDLNFNGINAINQSSFMHLPRLSRLVLTGNSIQNIEPEYFAQMKVLDSLFMISTRSRSINKHNSKWANNLFILDLSWNLFKELNPYAFYGLENLTCLYLNFNLYLHVINISSFTGLKSLKELELRDCPLQKMYFYIPALKSIYLTIKWHYFVRDEPFTHIFRCTQALEMIQIERLLSSVDLANWRGDYLFEGLTNLRYLYISYNDFWRYVPVETFRDLSSLQELYVNSSGISLLETNHFIGLTSLRLLDLRHNKIKHLPLLTHLYNLQYLYLDHNNLCHFNETTFMNATMLTFISLSNNFFVDFARSPFNPLNLNLLSIDISGNPLTCNCQIMWLVKFFKDVNAVNAEKIICSSSIGTLEPLKNKPLLEFDLNRLCGPFVAIYATIPVSVLVLSTLMFTVYHFRWYLKYKIFLLKLAMLGYAEIQDGRDPRDFEFDLHIVYADDDEIWIHDHLNGALIDKMPEYNRNAIGDESLNLGMYYLDAVYQVMERSYKIILIVSLAAVKNHLFLTKFRMAQDLVSDLKVEKMFVIFLEDIPDDEMPFVVRLFLSSRRPYLNWTDNERGREYFWERFEKLLKVNKRSDPLIPPE